MPKLFCPVCKQVLVQQEKTIYVTAVIVLIGQKADICKSADFASEWNAAW